MELRVIALFCSIFFCNKIAAQPPAWTLQPSVCIAQKRGDECQLNLNIETENMPSEQLCLFLDGQLLTCSRLAYFPKEISIAIQQDALLELKNKSQKVLLSKHLLIKYPKSTTQRRRIRPPWSLF